MIEFKNVSKTYSLEDQTVHALAGVTLTIADGEFVVILGPSGSGKSTLLHLLSGMDRPSVGSVVVNKQDLGMLKTNELAEYRRENVGMIFQQYQLVNTMSVQENIALPLKLAGVPPAEIDTAVAEAVELVGLTSRMKSVPAKLSGGQQQRVAIARALINKPNIIACDEPTGNLDTKTGDEIMGIIERLHQQGKTVVMVTHNEKYAQFANRVITMLDGAVVGNRKVKPQTASPAAAIVRQGQLGSVAIFKMAFKNLRRRLLRFFLTSIGIAIGAMAIVILVSFAASLQKSTTDQLSNFTQAEEVQVSGDATTNEVSFQMGPSFEQKEIKPLNDAVIAELQGIARVAAVFPSISFSNEIQVDDANAFFFGASLAPLAYTGTGLKDEVAQGRFIETDDEQSIVIPQAMATALGYTDSVGIIGKEAILKNFSAGFYGESTATAPKILEQKEFTVTIVGVYAAGDSNFSTTRAALPLVTSVQILKDLYPSEVSKEIPRLYDSLTIRAENSAEVPGIKDAVTAKGYGATTLGDILKTITKVYGVMQAVLGVLGGIALLVASLGVANTMFMAVLERTKEIGILKAIGARDSDVRKLFTYEATVIGFCGGVGGLLLGYAGNAIIGTVVTYYTTKNGGGEFFTVSVPFWLAFGAILFSMFFASVAGFFPARRAARLDPVDALREE